VPTTTAPVIGPAPGGGSGYVCGSGALVQGQPVTAGGTWTVTVVQPGLAPRTVAVRIAFA
jgi:hypothetical protein